MKKLLHFIAGAMLIVSPATQAAGKLKALIIDGQNNHKEWPKTTIIMRGYLEETGLYEVDIARTKFTWNGQQEAAFLPLAGVSGTEDLPNAKTDPDFKPDERAFYYARVLEIPTPRWNTYDAVRQQMAPLTKVPATIQERAWSSPIWYVPGQ